MKQVLNFIILPDDSVGEDTKTLTVHMLETDHVTNKTNYADGNRWDVAVLERFCVDALFKIGEIKQNNGGKL